MIVVAALAWYAESTVTLERCVTSLKGYCDGLVALGGRWSGFPEIPGDDPEEQANVISEACEKTGLNYEVGLGEWESQVEKRSDLMEQATDWSDWVLVIDADEYIEKGSPSLFRDGLDATGYDVARVFTYRIPTPYGRNIQRVYRSSTKVTVKTAHNGYMAEDGRFLNGDPCYVNLAPTAELGDHLTIVHDLTCRGTNRKQARQDYLRFRRKTRIESWR